MGGRVHPGTLSAVGVSFLDVVWVGVQGVF